MKTALLLSLLVLMAAPAYAEDPAPTFPHALKPESARPRLKQAGALHCLAWQASAAGVTTRLSCTLRVPNVKNSNATFEGEMDGKGLYLVSPGPIQVLWNVLAPTRYLPEHAVAGTYDTTGKFSFAYAQGNKNVLIGGLDDVVALELIAPTIDAIGPGTTLTLRRSGRSPATGSPKGADDAS